MTEPSRDSMFLGPGGARRRVGLMLMGGLVMALMVLAAQVGAYQQVRASAVQSYQAQQVATASAVSARVGSVFRILDGVVRGVDLGAMPDSDPGAWLDREAERLGLLPDTAEIVVEDAQGQIIVSSTTRWTPSHDHHVGGPCARCLTGGLLVFTSPVDQSGRRVTVFFPMFHLAPELSDNSAWLLGPEGALMAEGAQGLRSVELDPARTDPSLRRLIGRVREGGAGSARYLAGEASDGPRERRLASFAPVEQTEAGWAVVVSSAEEDAIAPVNGSLDQLAAVTAVTAVGIGLLLVGVARQYRSHEAARRRAQAERVAMLGAASHAERLALVGTMTAGIAHDLRGPLTGLMLGVEMLREPEYYPAEEVLLDVELSLDRLRGLADDLTRFARAETSTEQRGDAVAAAHATLRILGPAVRARCAVNSDPVGVPEAGLSEQRLTQLMTNLVLNAIDAGATRVVISLAGVGGAARIRVEDDGPGIPDELQTDVFNAFVTTRAPGDGTGLGLYLCRRFAEDAGGRIRLVASSLGGAGFEVCLPGVAAVAGPSGLPERRDLPGVLARAG